LLWGSYLENDKDGGLRRLVGERGQAYVILQLTADISLENLSEYYSISSVIDKNIEICVSPQTLEHFISQNFDYIIVAPEDTKAVISANTIDEAMLWESYPTYTQYGEIIRLFSENYPEICKVDTIGTSVNGKNILAVKISDKVGTDEDEPELFYSSTMHGDELGGFVLMLRFVHYLLQNYGTDPKVTALVDNLEIYVNPLANPDGTYGSGDAIVSPTRLNANQKDLNRNFPDIAGTVSTVIQKETTDMMEFIRGRRFILSANFHSGAEVVNYPWDRWSRPHADDAWFYNISRMYADTAHAYSLTPYMTFLDNGVTNGYDWYTTVGCRQDWVTYFMGGRETTIEIDDTKLTPASNLDSLWIRNRESLLGYLGHALKGVTGIVTDSLTGLPLKSKVYIEGYDKDSSHVYSDSIVGRFRRMLAPGEYELRFAAEGYTEKIVSIALSSNMLISNDIQLVPVDYVPEEPEEPEEPGIPLSLDLQERDLLTVFPNPVATDSEFSIYLPTGFGGMVNVVIYDFSGSDVYRGLKIVPENSVIMVDAPSLSPGIYFLVVADYRTKGFSSTRFIVVD